MATPSFVNMQYATLVAKPDQIKLWYLSSPLFCCPLVFEALFEFMFVFMPLLFVAFPPRCAIMLLIDWLFPMVFPLPGLAHAEDAFDCDGGGLIPNAELDPCPGGGGIENEEPRKDDSVPSDGRWPPMDIPDRLLFMPPMALLE